MARLMVHVSILLQTLPWTMQGRKKGWAHLHPRRRLGHVHAHARGPARLPLRLLLGGPQVCSSQPSPSSSRPECSESPIYACGHTVLTILMTGACSHMKGEYIEGQNRQSRGGAHIWRQRTSWCA